MTGDSIIEASSFEAAFTENFRAIHRFLAHRVGTPLADDLAAETFAVAYRRRAAFDPLRGGVRPWLFGIASMLLRAHLREEQQWLRHETQLTSEPAPPVASTQDAVLATVLAPRLGEALARLSDEQRDVLLLHAWGELSCEEVATVLEQPAGTVRSQLSRARAHLRDALGSSERERQPSREGLNHERA